MKIDFNSNFLILIFACLIVVSCKPKKPVINCEVVESLVERDQRYRKRHDLFSPYFFLLDSLVKDKGYVDGLDALTSLDGQMQNELRSKARELKELRPKPDQHLVDSLWKLQKELDYENTIQLLAIVKTVGFPALDTMDFDCSKKSFIIFVHSPDSLKNEVREVIELGANYIDSGQYEHIMWHLNGRKPHQKGQ